MYMRADDGVYIRMCIHVHTCVYVCACMCVGVYVYVYVHANVCMCMLMCMYVCANGDDVSRKEQLAGPFKFAAGSEQVFSESECCIDPTSLMRSPHGSYDPKAGNHTVPITLVMTTCDNGKMQKTRQARIVCV